MQLCGRNLVANCISSVCLDATLPCLNGFLILFTLVHSTHLVALEWLSAAKHCCRLWGHGEGPPVPFLVELNVLMEGGTR